LYSSYQMSSHEIIFLNPLIADMEFFFASFTFKLSAISAYSLGLPWQTK